MSLLAVTGGTGFVGGEFLKRAAETGHHVRTLTRRDQPGRHGVEWIAGDLADRNALDALLRGADAAIHIAGRVTAPDRAAFAEANIVGTQNTLDAATANGVSRFLHISSLAAREPEVSDYGWSKAGAEQRVRASTLDWTILRPPAVYGPGDIEMLDLFKMAKRGWVVLPPPGRLSLIHVRDLCDAMLACVKATETMGTIYEPDGGTANGLSHAEFARQLGMATGGRGRPVSMPAPLVRLGARLDRLLRGQNAKLTPDRARYFCHPDWVSDPEKHLPENLWTPSIPLTAGLAATVEWYRHKGWLA